MTVGRGRSSLRPMAKNKSKKKEKEKKAGHPREFVNDTT